LPLDARRNLGFLEDGDEVVLSATAPTATGRLTLGECRGRIVPARRNPGRRSDHAN
jgi:fumarylacetoacetase